jgi:putative acetyltransferase
MARRPTIGLRPFLPADAPVLASIFAESIAELTGEDYSEAQQQAWMASVEDEERLAAELAGQLTLVATIEGEAVGFASLKGADHVEMLYVHPDAGRLGVASALCDALEKLAGARGATKLTVDASDTAHDFFRRRGYVDQQRSTLSVGDEWLTRTRMQKTLTPASREPLQ